MRALRVAQSLRAGKICYRPKQQEIAPARPYNLYTKLYASLPSRKQKRASQKTKAAAIERINFALLYRAGLEQRGAVGKNRRLKRSRNRYASMQNPGFVFICLYLSRTVKFKKSHLCDAPNSAGYLSLTKEALTAAQNVSRNRAKPHRPQPTHR